MPIEIFGFSGKLGVGKNYVAEKLFWPRLPRKNTLVMAFGDHFKIDALVKEGLSYEKVFHKKDEETRLILQKLGTEKGRNVYGEDVWVRTMDAWVKLYSERGIERIIITDVRFSNEAEWILAKGGMLFRINAKQRNLDKLEVESGGVLDKRNQIMEHRSETSLDLRVDLFHYVIDNDYEILDVNELTKKVVNIGTNVLSHRMIEECIAYSNSRGV